jgi:hypothetical protein
MNLHRSHGLRQDLDRGCGADARYGRVREGGRNGRQDSLVVRVETHVHDLDGDSVGAHHEASHRTVEPIPRGELLQLSDHLHRHLHAHVPHLSRDRGRNRGVDPVPDPGRDLGDAPAWLPGHDHLRMPVHILILPHHVAAVLDVAHLVGLGFVQSQDTTTSAFTKPRVRGAPKVTTAR